jgi:hypothetical protein
MAIKQKKIIWIIDGSKPCPLKWADCEQPIFKNAITGEVDDGELDGPSNTSCKKNCQHNLVPPEQPEI